MCKVIVLLFLVRLRLSQSFDEDSYYENKNLAKVLLNALQSPQFDREVTFDLKRESQVYLNRTISLLIKYIVKREVDNYRQKRADAISRKIYSALVMKLIDIARDLPSNQSAAHRIIRAHHHYMSVETRDLHDDIADRQLFHCIARLYEILLTAPKILSSLGNIKTLTSMGLVRQLQKIYVKPIHLGILLLIQYHLRHTVNYAVKFNAVETLSAEPHLVGPNVTSTLKELAALLLPVVELLDIHLAHASPVFKDTCPATWLGIVNNK